MREVEYKFKNKLLLIGVHSRVYPRNLVLHDELKKIYEVTDISLKNDRKKYYNFFVEVFKWGRTHSAIMVTTPPEIFFLSVLCYRLFFPKNTIIIDMFIPVFEANVLDRKLVSKVSVKSFYYWLSGAIILRLATKVIFDTDGHRKFVEQTYFLSEKRLQSVVLPVSVNLSFVNRIKPVVPDNIYIDENKKIFLFYGKYIPLQGISYIVKAISLLRQQQKIHEFQFIFVGDGQTKAEIRKEIKALQLEEVITMYPSISYDSLLALVKSVDVIFGVFGETEKATLVIPNKVIEGLACGKVVITGRNQTMEEFFHDKINIFFADMANPGDIAQVIEFVALNFESINTNVGGKAKEIVQENFSEISLRKKIHNLI